jgi:hypothetical protein
MQHDVGSLVIVKEQPLNTTTVGHDAYNFIMACYRQSTFDSELMVLGDSAHAYMMMQ